MGKQCKTSLYAGTSENAVVLEKIRVICKVHRMNTPSDNPSAAPQAPDALRQCTATDNQQEIRSIYERIGMVEGKKRRAMNCAAINRRLVEIRSLLGTRMVSEADSILSDLESDLEAELDVS